MNEDLITLELAKLLPDIGCNIITKKFHTDNLGLCELCSDGKTLVSSLKGILYDVNGEFETGNTYSASTKSLLQKYLREKYNCYVEVNYYSNNITKLIDIRYSVEVNYYGKNFELPITEDADLEKWGFSTYEDALEYGLFEAMKLIKVHEILP